VLIRGAPLCLKGKIIEEIPTVVKKHINIKIEVKNCYTIEEEKMIYTGNIGLKQLQPTEREEIQEQKDNSKGP
jgi:hypothetical protein